MAGQRIVIQSSEWQPTAVYRALVAVDIEKLRVDVQQGMPTDLLEAIIEAQRGLLHTAELLLEMRKAAEKAAAEQP